MHWQELEAYRLQCCSPGCSNDFAWEAHLSGIERGKPARLDTCRPSPNLDSRACATLAKTLLARRASTLEVV